MFLYIYLSIDLLFLKYFSFLFRWQALIKKPNLQVINLYRKNIQPAHHNTPDVEHTVDGRNLASVELGSLFPLFKLRLCTFQVV